MQKNFVKWMVGFGVVAVAIIATSFLNFGDNVVYFYTQQEAIAKAAELSDKTIKVGALVKPGSVVMKQDVGQIKFILTDAKGHDIAVSYQGIAPDMFKENQGVVVEGRIHPQGDKITSHNLMVKHSEEYKKPEDHGSMNKALLEEAIFKNEKSY